MMLALSTPGLVLHKSIGWGWVWFHGGLGIEHMENPDDSQTLKQCVALRYNWQR